MREWSCGQIFRLLYRRFRDLDGCIHDQICCILRKEEELEKLGVVGVNYRSQEPITLQLRLNYAFFAPKRGELGAVRVL